MTRYEATEFARAALADVTDKAGVPLIAHSLRVAALVSDWGGSDRAVIVAILHDVVEDTAYTLDEVEERFPGVRESLDAITRRKGESYTAYIDRVALDETAKEIKVADIMDHLSPERIEVIPESLRRRYRRALVRLEKGAW